jgi:hypothetical protein
LTQQLAVTQAKLSQGRDLFPSFASRKHIPPEGIEEVIWDTINTHEIPVSVRDAQVQQ